MLAKLSQTLAGFVSSKHWMPQDHAQYAVREACEKATIVLAAQTPEAEIGALVSHLRDSGQLTAGLILRAILSGNIVLFEEAVTELCGLPLETVSSYIHDRSVSGFHALYRKAGLPDAAYPAFREAIIAMREGLLVGEHSDTARLKRRIVDYVLERCSEDAEGEMVPLLTALQRFAVEAARDEARMFCEDLVADEIGPSEQRLIAYAA